VEPPDIAVSISNLFPVVYGGLYHFNPSTQGLLYLPMLIGSLLAECGTGQAGDRCVAADLSSPLGMLIGRRNADYAAKEKGGDVEGPPYMNTLRRPGVEVRSDSTKVPEMRLILAFIGILISIVRGLRKVSQTTSTDLISRPVFYGSVSGLKTTFTGHILPSQLASRRTVPKWSLPSRKFEDLFIFSAYIHLRVSAGSRTSSTVTLNQPRRW